MQLINKSSLPFVKQINIVTISLRTLPADIVFKRYYVTLPRLYSYRYLKYTERIKKRRVKFKPEIKYDIGLHS